MVFLFLLNWLLRFFDGILEGFCIQIFLHNVRNILEISFNYFKYLFIHYLHLLFELALSVFKFDSWQ